jgi:hypothetical protein
MALNYFAKLERAIRKERRQRVRKNVRAYRERKQAEGFKRLELLISENDHKALRALMCHGETMSAALSRLLSGNRESVNKAQRDQR